MGYMTSSPVITNDLYYSTREIKLLITLTHNHVIDYYKSY